ncbi:MAG: tetratricopeptide repeat protein [Oculatellaceae cyanobacterium bins.114]|nr:tetratricopeptide repeat protein [Oculatellaceae cyanobacterium bins.114]
MAKIALLIGVSNYHSGLNPLPAAVRDVEAMRRVLQDSELGEFDRVKPLLNPEPQAMQYEIETLFSNCTKDDLVLLYFSGHGIKDDNGNLYFATPITQNNARGDLIRSSAVAARFVHDVLHNSRARRQTIILDCCFSGAFDPQLRLKDDGSVDVSGQLGAEGRVVLTSSSSTQYSLELADSELSLYTRYLVEGIETGAGDVNEDGQISVQELHHYAFDRVRATAPNMTPKLICLKDLGFEIILSKARVADPRLRYRKMVTRYATGDTIRPAGRAVLNTLRQQLGLTQPETDDIEAEVFRPYRERIANLQKYQETLLAEAKHEYPLGEDARDALKTLQQLLGLRDADIAAIEQDIAAQFAQSTTPIAAVTTSSVIPQPPKPEPATQTPTKSLTAEEFLDRGNEKYNAGDKQGAIADYTEAIRLKPDYAFAYNNRGVAKKDLGDKQGAIEDCTEAIRLKPDYAEAYNNRGAAKKDLGDKQGAIADYSEAIRLKPDDADTYNNRGVAKKDLGDKQGAIADYTEAIRLKCDYAFSYNNRGAAKKDLGDKQGAIADYNEAIRLKLDYADAYYNRGIAKADLGDKQGAIADYTKTISLKPDYAYAYLNRGLAKSDLGDKQGALADYREAAKLYQQQGNTELHRYVLNQIEELEKQDKGFWGRLFS